MILLAGDVRSGTGHVVDELATGLAWPPLSLSPRSPRPCWPVGGAGDRRPAAIIRAGFALSCVGVAVDIPLVVPRRPPHDLGCGLGLLVSQLNNYTLAPIDQEWVSDAAAQHEQISAALEHDAEVMRNTQLEQQITQQPPAVEAEILAINEDALNLSLQVPLAIPLLAGLLGLANSFRVMRLPDLDPSASLEGHRRRLMPLGLYPTSTVVAMSQACGNIRSE
jgi:hypothetical protein